MNTSHVWLKGLYTERRNLELQGPADFRRWTSSQQRLRSCFSECAEQYGTSWGNHMRTLRIARFVLCSNMA